MKLETLDKMPRWAVREAERIVQQAFMEGRETTPEERSRLAELSQTDACERDPGASAPGTSRGAASS